MVHGKGSKTTWKWLFWRTVAIKEIPTAAGLAGYPRSHQFRLSYYAVSHWLMAVPDPADRESTDQLRKWFLMILECAQMRPAVLAKIRSFIQLSAWQRYLSFPFRTRYSSNLHAWNLKQTSRMSKKFNEFQFEANFTLRLGESDIGPVTYVKEV